MLEPLLSMLPDFQVRQEVGNAERSNEHPEMIDHSDEPVEDNLLHDALLSQPSQDHKPTDCQRDARQQAKSPYCLQDYATVPDPTSESIGELLTDDPLVSQCGRSSDLLASEGAAIFHDRRLSYPRRLE